MKINAKKINAIAGPWVDKDFHVKIYPRLDQASIPVFNQTTIPLTRLYDDNYWWELKAAHRIDFAVIDYHHWQYDDDVFDKYVERIASVRFPILCIAECPFGFERPLQIDPKDFTIKLFERTRQIASAVRKNHPNTILLSPGIASIDEQFTGYYLDYFINNRQFFDGYAVHICDNMKEHSLGQMSSLLNQVLTISPKKLWVTKWSVPTFDGQVINTSTVAPADWQPFKAREAIQRLSRSFSLVETVASAGSHWFYTGTGKDYYKPRKTVGAQEFWNSPSSSVVPQNYSHSWEFWHFLGLMDADAVVKDSLLQGLLQLAKSKNG